jgi:hypothetical protein
MPEVHVRPSQRQQLKGLKAWAWVSLLIKRTSMANQTTTPQGEAIDTMIASLAKRESALASEWVKGGMASPGQSPGQAALPCPNSGAQKGVQACIAEPHTQALSIHRMSQQLGIGYGTA